MNSDRIKEIQSKTAYPDSISVQQALFQVWNEVEQETNRQLQEDLKYWTNSHSVEQETNHRLQEKRWTLWTNFSSFVNQPTLDSEDKTKKEK
jgi:hypothetical protein